jgi:hypothetical protein
MVVNAAFRDFFFRRSILACVDCRELWWWNWTRTSSRRGQCTPKPGFALLLLLLLRPAARPLDLPRRVRHGLAASRGPRRNPSALWARFVALPPSSAVSRRQTKMFSSSWRVLTTKTASAFHAFKAGQCELMWFYGLGTIIFLRFVDLWYITTACSSFPSSRCHFCVPFFYYQEKAHFFLLFMIWELVRPIRNAESRHRRRE